MGIPSNSVSSLPAQAGNPVNTSRCVAARYCVSDGSENKTPRIAMGHRPRKNRLAARTTVTYSYVHRPTNSAIEYENTRMCLLCEELWMPFELPPEAKARTFVADSPEADGAPRPVDPMFSLPAGSSSGDGEKPPPRG
jgi:hypothetical protein